MSLEGILEKGFATTTLDALINWSRNGSMWPLSFGLACCAIEMMHGYGAYICGEETALLESLEGKKGMPRFKPPFPASVGLYGKPTTINNTETLAAVPWIIRHGAEAFLNLGRPNNGGTKIFSISGDVERPGNYEVRLGMPFAELLQMAGGMRLGWKVFIPITLIWIVFLGAMMQTRWAYLFH